MSISLITQSQVAKMTEEEKKHFFLYNPQCYVSSRVQINQNSLLDKCFQIITKAFVYKGLNIDSEKIKSMSMLFCEDISKKFGYVSIYKIEEVLQDNKYGEGFNVSVKGLVDVLDIQLFEINKANKLRELALKNEAKTPLLADNRTEEEKQLAVVQKAYEAYLEYDFFFDLNNEVFQFIFENGLYDWSEEEDSRASKIAMLKTKEYEENRLSKAKKSFSLKEVGSISDIINTNICKSDSFASINKTEHVKIYFEKLKAENIKKITTNSE